MGLKLNTASGGSVSIEPTNTASDYTLTVPAQTGTVVATNSSGNVGIGTSSPSNKLSISSSGGTQADITDTGGANATLKTANGANTTWFGADGSSPAVGPVANASLIWGFGAYPILFANGNAERMRIDTEGYLQAHAGTGSLTSANYHSFRTGTGSSTWVMYQRHETGTSGNAYGTKIEYRNVAPNGTGNEFLFCSDMNNTRATIRSNGGLANYSANNTNLSDAREKTNVELAGSYLDKICSIPVKTFNYIDQNLEEDGGLTLGVIAQEVQAVAPELVTESNWGSEEDPKMRLSIYQTDLQYALMKCIQEQQTIITSQASAITALEARLTALENK